MCRHGALWRLGAFLSKGYETNLLHRLLRECIIFHAMSILQSISRTLLPRLALLVAALPLWGNSAARNTAAADTTHIGRPFYIGVGTNLLYDAAAVPTVNAEVAFAERWSVGAEGSYIWIRNYNRNRHWRIEGGQVYVRRWWGQRGGQPLTGHHLGVYGQLYTFQIQLADSHGFISGRPGEDLGGRPGWGVGVEYGYSLRLAHRLSLDFNIGLGYFRTTVNRYGPCADPCCCTDCPSPHHYELQRSHTVNWVGPTRAGISLVWCIGPVRCPCEDVAQTPRP